MKKLIAVLVIGFILGFMVSNWRNDSMRLDDVKTAITLQQKNQKISKQQGKLLEDKLTEKRKNDETFNQNLATNIHENSDNACFDDAFVELFNNKISQSRVILSRKPAR